MQRSVTERLRLTPSEQRLLERLAREEGKPKSEILREGLFIKGRIRERKKNMHRLIEAADAIPGDDIKPEWPV